MQIFLYLCCVVILCVDGWPIDMGVDRTEMAVTGVLGGSAYGSNRCIGRIGVCVTASGVAP